MIHGDLKGVCILWLELCLFYPADLSTKANILIDQTGNARLADFGLLTIISDPTNHLSSSSYIQGGTARWMSPELIDPQRFGLKNSRPSKSSDCYALGMVIYETINGHSPFHQHADLTVIVKVLAGERPLRGEGFTESLWKMLGQCWISQPNNRPSIEDVVQCLESDTYLRGLKLHSQQHHHPQDTSVQITNPGDDHADIHPRTYYARLIGSRPDQPIELATMNTNSGSITNPPIGPGSTHTNNTNSSPLMSSSTTRIGTPKSTSQKANNYKAITLCPCKLFSGLIWVGY